ncbi:hypothetical protein ACU4GD_35990 [Cupriavidus basilensis]
MWSISSATASARTRPKPAKHGDGTAEGEGGDGKESPLEQFTQNLNTLAKAGKIDPLIGRESEVEQVVQNAVPPAAERSAAGGRGRCRQDGAVAGRAGLAHHQGRSAARHILAKSAVYSLDMGALLAGTKYRGDFRATPEGRWSFKSCPIRRDPVHRRDPHADRRGRRFGRDAPSTPATCSSRRCRRARSSASARRRSPGISRHLREGRGAVAPLPGDRRGGAVGGSRPCRILRGLKSRFEEHHGVKYAAAALTAAAELSARFITDRLPA